MATRFTRKELKADKFAVEVEHTVEYVAEHRKQLMRWSAVAGAAVLIAAGVYFYRSHQHSTRQQELAHAIQIQEAPYGPVAPGTPLSFPTQEDKAKEATKAFTELSVKYSGTVEGGIAQYYLGCIATDQGKVAEAEKIFKDVASSAKEEPASLAKVALADLYFAQGKAADGEKVLRLLIDHPTAMVSKEQATIALARNLARTNPQEARKLLEPLRTARSAVSQAAISALGDLPAAQ